MKGRMTELKLLYGTSNPSKLQHMREMLDGLDIDIIGLAEAGINKKNIDITESGETPLENARIKSLTYYKVSGIPTFSCDSGLFIEGLDDQEQPGVHVRRVNGKCLDDEEFIKHYTGILNNLGKKKVLAKFKNAICLVLDQDRIYEYDGDDIADKFYMTSAVHQSRKKGFPMDSIAIDIKTGKYLVETDEDSNNEEEITQGFRNFFGHTILYNKKEFLTL